MVPLYLWMHHVQTGQSHAELSIITQRVQFKFDAMMMMMTQEEESLGIWSFYTAVVILVSNHAAYQKEDIHHCQAVLSLSWRGCFFRYGSDFVWSTKEDGKHLKIEDFTRLNWLEWLRQACPKISMRTTAAVTQMMKDQVSYLAAMFTTAKALAGNTAFWNRTPFPAFVSGGNNQDPIYKVESSDHFTGVFFPSPPPCIQYKHKINMGCCMSYEQEV